MNCLIVMIVVNQQVKVGTSHRRIATNISIYELNIYKNNILSLPSLYQPTMYHHHHNDNHHQHYHDKKRRSSIII